MANTYNPATDAGRVRLLIPDTNTTTAVYSDDEIAAFLALNDGDIYAAAADAVETIASSEAMVGKMIVINGMSSHGAYVANSLLSRARQLRARAAESVEYVGIASAAVDEWTWTELNA
jgi:hypothetical protein